MPFQLKFHRRSISAQPLDDAAPSIDWGGMTDAGPKRSSNEDHFLVADIQSRLRLMATSVSRLARLVDGSGTLEKPLLMVADGVSGQPGGQIASELAVRMVVARLSNSVKQRRWGDPSASYAETVCEALVETGEALREMASPGLGGIAPGTTSTVALLSWPIMDLIHVGDSRCYLLRAGSLSQLTTDHTLAEELRGVGRPAAPKFSHVLTRAVGGECQLVDHRRLRMQHGDTLLLASDGLTDTLDRATLQEVLSGRGSASKRCSELIRAAVAAKSSDNVTAIVVTAS